MPTLNTKCQGQKAISYARTTVTNILFGHHGLGSWYDITISRDCKHKHLIEKTKIFYDKFWLTETWHILQPQAMVLDSINQVLSTGLKIPPTQGTGNGSQLHWPGSQFIDLQSNKMQSGEGIGSTTQMTLGRHMPGWYVWLQVMSKG